MTANRQDGHGHAPTINDLGDAAHEPENGPATTSTRKAEELRRAEAIAALLESLGHAAPEEPKPIPIPELDPDFVCNAAGDGDAGAARLFVKLNRARYLYDATAGQWMIFSGHRWTVDKANLWMSDVDAAGGFTPVRAVLRKLALVELKKASRPDASKEEQRIHQRRGETLTKAFQRLAGEKARRSAGVLAGTGDALGDDGEAWDKEQERLPVANGVVDLITGALDPGRPEDRFIIGSPVALDIGAECPRFEQFISEIFDGNVAKAAFFQRWIGYAICRNPKERVLLFMTGAGNNGKSLLIETLCHVLGPIAATVKTEMLLDRRTVDNPDAPSASRLKLRGRGPVFASEIKPGAAFDTSTLKNLTGNDTITARAPYAKFEFEFRPTHTLGIACNDLPKLPARAEAVWNRVLVLDFPVAFLPPEKLDANNPMHRPIDRDLGAKLLAEATGILGWMVKGALLYHRDDLAPPAEVLAATEQYRRDVDVIGDFLAERCEDDPNGTVGITEMFQAWCRWADGNHVRAGNKKQFADDLLSRGKYRRGRDRSKRLFEGIVLLPED